MTTVHEVAGWVDRARRVVVLTGAGISTDSGIPDFRGPDGVWTKNPGAERTSTLQHYLADPEVRRQSWQGRLGSPIWAAQPNAGHHALAALDRAGRLDTLVTQNIDGLHQKAGVDPARVIEIHGSALRYACWTCGQGGPMEDALDRVRAGEDDPACLACGGILKSTTISFGQNLVVEDLERAEAAAERADLFMAVGTTLGVYPAAALFPVARRAGATTVIVNLQPTPYDDLAHAVLNEPIGEVLPVICGGG
jgi:NAD-dependent deacetylase